MELLVHRAAYAPWLRTPPWAWGSFPAQGQKEEEKDAFPFDLFPPPEKTQEVMRMLPAYFELKSCLVEHEQLVLTLPTNPAWSGNSHLGFLLHLELGSPDSEWQGLQRPQALVQVPEVT